MILVIGTDGFLKKFTEKIPVVGQKYSCSWTAGILQRCRKGTCFCRKNICSWTEGILANVQWKFLLDYMKDKKEVSLHGYRISANIRKGFLWNNWRYTCKMAERISVVVLVCIHIYIKDVSGGSKGIPANWQKGFFFIQKEYIRKNDSYMLTGLSLLQTGDDKK